jgi:hypothetical protein
VITPYPTCEPPVRRRNALLPFRTRGRLAAAYTELRKANPYAVERLWHGAVAKRSRLKHRSSSATQSSRGPYWQIAKRSSVSFYLLQSTSNEAVIA